MHKKLMMACMAIAAFAAFVVAPAASASPVLTENGARVPATNPDGVKTLLISTNVGNTVFTGTGGTEVKCDHVKLTGELTKNTGNEIEGEITTADFNGTGAGTDCTSNLFNAPVGVTVGKLCISVKAVPADELVTTGCGGAVTFTLNFTGLVTCKYSRASVKAKFTTGGTQVTANNTEETTLVEGGGFCPAGGFLDMTYETWTDVNGVETGPALTIS